MYKLTRSSNPKRPLISANTLKIGDLFEINTPDRSDIQGNILLRTFDNLVNLNNPRGTWSIKAPLQGHLLTTGESITLTQE